MSKSAHNKWRCFECKFPECVGCKQQGFPNVRPTVPIPPDTSMEFKGHPGAFEGAGHYCNDCRYPACKHGNRRQGGTASRWIFHDYNCPQCIADEHKTTCLKCKRQCEPGSLRLVEHARAPNGRGYYCLDCHFLACHNEKRQECQVSARMFEEFKCEKCLSEVQLSETKKCLRCEAPMPAKSRQTTHARAPEGP